MNKNLKPDISPSLKTVIKEAEKHKEIYRTLMENINYAVIITDQEYNIIEFNKAAEKLYGYKSRELIGKNMGKIIPTEYIDTDRETVKKLFKEKGFWHGEVTQKSKNGKKVNILATVNLINHKQKKDSFIIAINQDITEKKKIEQERIDSFNKIKKISDEKDLIFINTCSKLEKELHDTVTQDIFAASILAEALPDTMKRNSKIGKKHIKLIRKIISKAYSEMRMIIFQLHPPKILEDRLDESLKKLVNEFKEKTDIKIYAKIKCFHSLKPNVKKYIYRIAQESLNNVLKHSKAKWVRLELKCTSEKFSLIIIDNGKGFDTNMISTKKFGLNIMQERAEIINAKLDIISEKKKGTEIAITNINKLDDWLIKE